jgi:hypothetical protein
MTKQLDFLTDGVFSSGSETQEEAKMMSAEATRDSDRRISQEWDLYQRNPYLRKTWQQGRQSFNKSVWIQ